MKLLMVMAALIWFLYPLEVNIAESDRRHIPIADVDKRAWNKQPYLLYISEYDTERQIAEICGVGLDQFTGRGCTKGYRLDDGRIVYRVIVLSNDYEALTHELDHVVFGPCHTNSGETSKGCRQWLIDNNLPPIGTEELIQEEEDGK